MRRPSTRKELFEGTVENIVNALHRMADEIEREQKDPLVTRDQISRSEFILPEEELRATELAEFVVHTVTWGISNLSLDILIRRAVRVDEE